ncbi:MAG: hypothetical protein ACYYK0_06385 [Candidatus Eutrophobiaceae bacterium]
MINTVTGMAIDIHKRQLILGNVQGGLSAGYRFHKSKDEHSTPNK